MSKWSDSLVASSIPEFLIEDVERQVQESLLKLKAKVESKKDFQKLKKQVKSFKTLLDEGLYESLLEELDEIKENLSWSKSDHGKYNMILNDWAQTFHKELCEKRQSGWFPDLVVGGHIEKQVVLIAGKLQEGENIKEFIEYVNSKKPPYKIEVKIFE